MFKDFYAKKNSGKRAAVRALYEKLRLNELPTYPNHRAQPSQKENEGNTILEQKPPLDYSTLFFFFSLHENCRQLPAACGGYLCPHPKYLAPTYCIRDSLLQGSHGQAA
jgi:hypothetical protein